MRKFHSHRKVFGCISMIGSICEPSDKFSSLLTIPSWRLCELGLLYLFSMPLEIFPLLFSSVWISDIFFYFADSYFGGYFPYVFCDFWMWAHVFGNHMVEETFRAYIWSMFLQRGFTLASARYLGVLPTETI